MTYLPMPGEKHNGSTVVASVYSTDDTGLLLVLNPATPYYTVREVDLIEGFVTVWQVSFENINPAVRRFRACGGDD